MPIIKKADTHKSNAIKSDKVKDRRDEPYFLKKAEDAKEFLRKHPLPDHLKNK